MNRTKVLFASRRFPPSTGGMETYSKAMYDALSRDADVVAVTLGRTSYAHLVWYLPWLFVRAAAAIIRGVDVFVAADPIVLAVVRPLLLLRETPAVVFVHGLDLTYSNGLYQRLVGRPLRRADRVVANSRATAQIADSVGIPSDRLVVVPAATELRSLPEADVDVAAALRERFGLPDGAQAIVTLGRLVPRKGVAWFTAHVMPGLPAHIHHLVAGSGPEHDRVVAAIADHDLHDRVHLLGSVDDDDRELLLRGGIVFVMPNIVVPGDMEGFGLVAVEAALRDSVVVASGIEGINDAVVDGETGILVTSGDPRSFLDALEPLLDDEAARAELARRFGANARRMFGPEATSDRLRRVVVGVLG